MSVEIEDLSVARLLSRLLSNENRRLEEEVQRLRSVARTLDDTVTELRDALLVLKKERSATKAAYVASQIEESMDGSKKKTKRKTTEESVAVFDSVELSPPRKSKKHKHAKEVSSALSGEVIVLQTSSNSRIHETSNPTSAGSPNATKAVRTLARETRGSSLGLSQGPQSVLQTVPRVPRSRSEFLFYCYEALHKHQNPRSQESDTLRGSFYIHSGSATKQQISKLLNRVKQSSELNAISTCLIATNASLEVLGNQTTTRRELIFVLPKYTYSPQKSRQRVRWTSTEPFSLITGHTDHAPWVYQGEFQCRELFEMPEAEYNSNRFSSIRNSLRFSALLRGFDGPLPENDQDRRREAHNHYPGMQPTHFSEACVVGFWLTGWNDDLVQSITKILPNSKLSS